MVVQDNYGVQRLHKRIHYPQGRANRGRVWVCAECALAHCLHSGHQFAQYLVSTFPGPRLIQMPLAMPLA
jgi:hypothetical protein